MKAVCACGLVIAVLAGTTLAVRAAAPPTAQAPQNALTIRLYNTSGIPAATLVAARHATESILRDTGLTVVIRHCGRSVAPEDAPDACDQPLKPSELVVRIIDAPAFNTTLHPDAYGLAYVVQETNRGWLATVFSDRIDRVATRLNVDPGTLLGLVAAHEVGHLLLGSTYHAEGGLMRADWSDALLAREAREWRFSTGEAARIHSVIASLLSGVITTPVQTNF
jgi:hypothetical protein